MLINGWNADHLVTDAQLAKLQDQVLMLCTDKYTLPDGTVTEGVAFSWCVKELRQQFGWKNLGSVGSDFEKLFVALGFRVVRGARNRRNGKAEIVTL